MAEKPQSPKRKSDKRLSQPRPDDSLLDMIRPGTSPSKAPPEEFAPPPLPGSPPPPAAKPRTRSKGAGLKEVWQELLENRTIMGGLISATVLLVGGLIILEPWSNESEEQRRRRAVTLPEDAATALPPPPSRSPRKPVTIQCYTPEPGFYLFVDGEPARSESGELLKTPCEVAVESGDHLIGVVSAGWLPESRVVKLDQTEALDFAPQPEPFTDRPGVFSSPYFTAEVGRPIPLSTLNDVGQFTDPFLSPDGLSIWMSGAGNEGRGIYNATRTSPYDEFGPPEFLLLSKTNDRTAAPSTTADVMTVAYAIPEKARVWGLVRPSPLGMFDDRQPLFASDKDQTVWLSTLIAGDGKTLYWLERREGAEPVAFQAIRYAQDEPFEEPKKLHLPGGHAVMSRDGLRQYLFDGKVLQRARRANLKSAFAPPEKIRDLDLPNYDPHPEFRQFWVSEDEQWFYYAADPTERGALHVARLSLGPGWGYAPTGKSIPQRVAPPTEEMPEPTETTATTPATTTTSAPVDPRTLPLPYAAFQKRFAELMRQRDYPAARKWLEEQRKLPELAKDLDLMEWDETDVIAAEDVWKAVREALAAYKPEESIRIAGNPVNLIRYNAKTGIIVARGKTKEVEKRVIDLAPTDVTYYTDRVREKTDTDTQLHLAIFLFYDAGEESRSVTQRLSRAGGGGKQFQERRAQRELRLIDHEIARDNTAIALKQIDQLISLFPNTAAAKQAVEYRGKAYNSIDWKLSGGRAWNITADGEYGASPERFNDSYLLTPESYKNFELTLEWKTEGQAGQGGVYFRYPGTGRLTDLTAYKLQLASDFGVRADKYCTGALFNAFPPSQNKVRATGEWNQLVLRVEGERVRTTINGTQVLDVIATSEDIPLEGYIALDGTVGGITYRKVLLVELP